jgi:hypothetical protein
MEKGTMKKLREIKIQEKIYSTNREANKYTEAQ